MIFYFTIIGIDKVKFMANMTMGTFLIIGVILLIAWVKWIPSREALESMQEEFKL